MLPSNKSHAENPCNHDRKCAGHFCHLVNSLHSSRDLVSATTVRGSSATAVDCPLTSNSIVLNAKEAKLSQQRERAACILRRVLTEKEWTKLEEAREILQLRIPCKVNPTEFSLVSHESIELAKKENRLALSLLRDAEEALSRGELQIDDIIYGDSADNRGDESDAIVDDSVFNTAEGKKVRVCGVCRNVYQLLDKVRGLIMIQSHDDGEEDNSGFLREENAFVPALEVKLNQEEVEPQTNQSQYLKSIPKVDAPPARGDMANSPRQRPLQTFSSHSKATAKSKALITNNRTINRHDQLRASGVFGKVLLCIEDEETEEKARKILEKERFSVISIKVPSISNAPHELHSFDACVVSSCIRDKKDLTRWLKVKKAVRIPAKHLPIVIVTYEAAATSSTSSGQSQITWNPTASDAALVMAVLKALDPLSGEKTCKNMARIRSKSSFGISLRKKTNAIGHSTAKSTSPIQRAYRHTDGTSNHILRGSFQSDECTSFPFTVLGGCNSNPSGFFNNAPDRSPSFNLIVCHDIFDTQERMEILLQPIISKHQGIQVLLWNYPGQAFTEFSDQEVLNNMSLAGHLDRLLRHLGAGEKGQFDTGLPFYILGYGSGAAVAMAYAVTYDQPHLRGLLLVNGVSFVYPKYASVLLRCKEVFSCCPEGKLDLPAFFYARYLFSPQYLNQVSASLALNLHTAIHNPISLQGRIRLCLGALQHIDTRLKLATLGKPVVFLHGKDSAIVTPNHVKELSASFEGYHSSCRTVNDVAKGGRSGIVVVAIDGGHELFQERKEKVLRIIERLLVGHFENEEWTSNWIDISDNNSKFSGGNGLSLTKQFFRTCYNGSAVNCQGTQPINKKSDEVEKQAAIEEMDAQLPSQDHMRESKSCLVNKHFQPSKRRIEARKQKMLRKTQRNEGSALLLSQQVSKHSLDMKQQLQQQQQQQQQQRTKHQSLVLHSDLAPSYPEVKEFMRWRQRRNRDRLRKMHRAALCIQKTTRCMIARNFLLNSMFHSAALKIQSCCRGMNGRKRHWEKRRAVKMIILLQRVLRTFISRLMCYKERKKCEIQVKIAKRWLGKTVREAFRHLLLNTSRFVTKIQCFYRLFIAKGVKKKLWIARISCIALQRACRGYLARCKAREEHKKYLFSRNQSTGIELARQMLTECRLRATKLHSEIVLLDEEKVFFEEQIDATINEINKCEHGVQNMESEMHQLCLLELDHADMLSWKAKCEAREKKIRLDKSFSETLARISDRRDYLNDLQGKIKENERTRQLKYDEIQKLERKLVVLLDAQNIELSNIRRCQVKRCSNLEQTRSINDHRDDIHVSSMSAGTVQTWTGPTEKERLEAAQLMDSTEAMIKFGFMGMSMSYLGSLNLMKSMKKVAAHDALLASPSALEQVMPKVSKTRPTSSSLTSSAKWKVEDVLEWLTSLNLGQYRDAFQYGAVDGSLLFALNEEDLLNTLGVEHKLHRKKLLLSIDQLRCENAPSITSVVPSQTQVPSVESFARSEPETATIPRSSTTILDIETVFSWVRHQKFETLQHSLQDILDIRFDEINVRVQFVEGVGTVYVDEYEKVKFNMNKTDEYGNTMLHVAAQNGNMKIAELLIQKGCNPNHQNKQGNTPGHFAIAYEFYHFATWLFDADGGGANDLILNSSGLGAYDGITINERENKS